MNMKDEVIALGQFACDCELLADDPMLSPEDKGWLLHCAAYYREKQVEALPAPGLVAQAALDRMLNAGLDRDGTWCKPDHSLDGLREDIGNYQRRLRRTTPEAGHALEKLGHAVEYLTDQFVERKKFDEGDLAAIQVLMAANRQVYYDCPVRSSFLERVGCAIDRLVQKYGLSW